MKQDPFNKKDPLAEAAESVLIDENVEKIKKKVAQLKVGDKTNYGTVKKIGPDSITFKALHTPKTEIAFRQRKIGRPDYILMNLVKFTPDGKSVDKTFKEANDFTGAAAAAKVAGQDEFEFEGETYPVTISLDVAKKIMSQSLELAKKLAKKEESTDLEEEFVVKYSATKRGPIQSMSFDLLPDAKKFLEDKEKEGYKGIISKNGKPVKEELEERVGSLQNSLKVLSKAGIKGRVISDMPKFAKAIHKNYKDITGEKYQDSDQVAVSEVIADLIGYFRLDGEDFIDAWDNTIKEETEISEATEFVKGDQVMDVRTRVKGTVLHKGNKDEVYVDLGAIKKAISSKDLRLVEATELEEAKSSTGYELYHKDFSSAMAHAYEFAKKKYRIEVDPKSIDDEVATGPKRPSKGKTNRYRLLSKDGKKAIHVQVYGMDSGKYELNMYKEGEEELEEAVKLQSGSGFRGTVDIGGIDYKTQIDRVVKLIKKTGILKSDKDITDFLESGMGRELGEIIVGQHAKLSPATRKDDAPLTSFLKKQLPIWDSLEEDTELEEEISEAAGDEWFTCEVHIKSSGQLHSTFYVQAKNIGDANRKSEKVFMELMKTTYPKDWPSYSKKFTVKVKKGDNIGELMP